MLQIKTETVIDAEQTTPTSEQNLCRLCLNHDAIVTDMFVNDENTFKEPLIQRLYQLINIKYKECKSLPRKICRRCLYMVNSFSEFRCNVHKSEAELHAHLAEIKRRSLEASDRYRPGLNGNPGVFEPEQDCEITEVNPDQEYESSEDDFSMESESEADQSPPQSQLLVRAELPQVPSQTLQAKKLTMSGTPPDMSSAGHKLTAQQSQPIEGFAGDSNGQNSSHFISPDLLNAENYAKNAFLCQYCDMAFTTQQDCTEHEQRHDKAMPYVCAFCHLRTATRQNLINHIKELHKSMRPYICTLCTKGFCRRSDLKKHTIVHTGVRPFSCMVCAKSFSRNTNLTKHMRIHSSVKPHVCLRCPRSFSTANDLLRHARSHTEVKPFRCGRCSAAFARKDKLALHEEAHNRRESEFLQNQNAPTDHVEPLGPDAVSYSNVIVGEDPYRHSILATQLQQQQRPPAQKSSASKSQPRGMFSCEQCGQQFTREHDFRLHQALHLDTLFTCKQCGTGFSRPEKLARHELEQHAPQYPCNICRITFPKLASLESHLKMHELQQATQAALTAAQSGRNPGQSSVPRAMPLQRPTAADMSFYSQMVPTMNLGFYSETRPEDRNGV